MLSRKEDEAMARCSSLCCVLVAPCSVFEVEIAGGWLSSGGAGCASGLSAELLVLVEVP